jgi:hypothetical protein
MNNNQECPVNEPYSSPQQTKTYKAYRELEDRFEVDGMSKLTPCVFADILNRQERIEAKLDQLLGGK